MRVGSEALIETWRLSVPRSGSRHDPFEEEEEDSEFPLRPSTRLAHREADRHRPASRLSIFASKASQSISIRPLSRAATALGFRYGDEDSDAPQRLRRSEWFKGLFGKKRKREYQAEEIFDSAGPTEEKEPLRLNFLFVGGRSSGQTSLLFRVRYGCCPDTSGIARTCYETYTNERDTSGAPDLNTVERLAYMRWDAVFLCFDVTDKVSMYTITSWWHHAVENGFTAAREVMPILHLVGTKKDLRQAGTVEGISRTQTASSLRSIASCYVCPVDAVCHAERIGASYNEVSALTGEGLEEMIEATGKLAVERIVGPKIESESPATEERKRARVKKRRLFKKLG
ncbi:hypothetical protein NLU13_4438 [Sarocladium strictum]|uniref:Uncharacterized protein n=1 Tax=Sarocladium strictum TaxID=5046 RepID=A0AA39GIV4_SARSR|nr:hypothetical protein NLU13_4438 [Sarocladium strictum]